MKRWEVDMNWYIPQSLFMFHSTLNSPARIFVLCHGVIFQLEGGSGGREVSISILLRMDKAICIWLLSFVQQFTGTGWHPNQPHIWSQQSFKYIGPSAIVWFCYIYLLQPLFPHKIKCQEDTFPVLCFLWTIPYLRGLESPTTGTGISTDIMPSLSLPKMHIFSLLKKPTKQRSVPQPHTLFFVPYG